MSPNSATIASNTRQKQAGPYGTMLRKMTTRMKQLQEEVALESVTNIEFEESSRRSFEFLTGQVKTLKEAFNTLTDTFLQELEHLSGAISGEFFRLEEGMIKDVGDTLQKQEAVEKKTVELENQADQLSKDLDAVLGVIPKIEDSMLRTNGHVQDRLEQVSGDVGRSSTALQLLEDKVNRVETDLREELEQRLLKQQRSITRQLESMSRVLMTADDDRRTGEKTAHSLQGSGLGGPTFGTDRPFGSDRDRPTSPWRERPASPFLDRAPSDRGANDYRAPSTEVHRDRASDRGAPHSDRGAQHSDRGAHDRDRVPEPWREQDRDRDRDRPWGSGGASDRGSTDKPSVRSGTESRRTGDNNMYRSSAPGFESYRDRLPDRLSSVHDSPRQSSRRGNSPDAQSQTTARTSERLWVDPRQARRDSAPSATSGRLSEDRPASEVSAPKPGHIQVDFDLSGLQGAASPSHGRPR